MRRINVVCILRLFIKMEYFSPSKRDPSSSEAIFTPTLYLKEMDQSTGYLLSRARWEVHTYCCLPILKIIIVLLQKNPNFLVKPSRKTEIGSRSRGKLQYSSGGANRRDTTVGSRNREV